VIKFLSWIFDCSSICSVWKFTGDISMSTENEVTNIQKNWWFFLQSWNLFLNSFIKLESTATYFFFLLFTGLCLAYVSKCMILFAISWFSTALCPPLFLVSAQTVQSHTDVVCCWAMGVHSGPGCLAVMSSHFGSYPKHTKTSEKNFQCFNASHMGQLDFY